jgi:putative hydrolase of the HAD superfamily
MKRVLILDLDNTIYPVSSIADHLFAKLFKLIDENLGEADRQAAQKAKEELTRRPYQHVADEFGFSDELKEQGMQMLANIRFEEPMYPYEQYNDLRQIPIDKFLVTTGFTKLQMSKVEMLNIGSDFKQVYVVDPAKQPNKKRCFPEDNAGEWLRHRRGTGYWRRPKIRDQGGHRAGHRHLPFRPDRQVH